MDETIYEQCMEQEMELQFEKITQNDMLKLGWMIAENNKKYGGPLAVLIILNGKDVFSCYPDGTGEFHKRWLYRKANLVHIKEMSTLRAFLELKKTGESLEKDWLLSPSEYAACGGGFPIRLKNGCVVGSVCVSGLHHLQDHKAVVEGIQLYLAEEGVKK